MQSPLATKPILRSLVSIAIAAKFLDVHPRTVHRLTAELDIDIIEFSGRQRTSFFLRKEDVLKLAVRKPKPNVHGSWGRDKLCVVK